MIHICMATDDNYLEMCQLCIYDIIIHKYQDTEIYFHIFCDKLKDLTVFDKFKTIQKIYLSIIDCNSDEIIHVNRTYYTAFGNRKATYLRYLIPELDEFKNIDKVLYLDCDIFVKNDLSELYNTDINDYLLATPKKARMDCYYNGQFKNQYPWFDIVNVGVMLMNLEELRNIYFTQKCLTETFETGSNDEVVINTICFNRIKFISPIYNTQIGKITRNVRGFRNIDLINTFYGTNFKNLNDFLKSIVIAHLAGDKNSIYDKKPISLLLAQLRNRFNKFIETNQVEFVQDSNDDIITQLEYA